VTQVIEPIIFEVIRRKSIALHSPGLAVNGIEDHIHIALSIAPSVSVSEWVRSVKGLSTYEVNGQFPEVETPFRWQKSYGVLSYGEKHLPYVVNYIENQKQHHANQTIISYLKQVGDENDRLYWVVTRG
jgi:putative transposase